MEITSESSSYEILPFFNYFPGAKKREENLNLFFFFFFFDDITESNRKFSRALSDAGIIWSSKILV